MKNGRVVDYVPDVFPGDTHLKVGEQAEKETVEKENRKAEAPANDRPNLSPTPFYLSAWEEDKYIIAQANAELDEDGNSSPTG